METLFLDKQITNIINNLQKIKEDHIKWLGESNYTKDFAQELEFITNNITAILSRDKNLDKNYLIKETLESIDYVFSLYIKELKRNDLAKQLLENEISPEEKQLKDKKEHLLNQKYSEIDNQQYDILSSQLGWENEEILQLMVILEEGADQFNDPNILIAGQNNLDKILELEKNNQENLQKQNWFLKQFAGHIVEAEQLKKDNSTIIARYNNHVSKLSYNEKKIFDKEIEKFTKLQNTKNDVIKELNDLENIQLYSKNYNFTQELNDSNEALDNFSKHIYVVIKTLDFYLKEAYDKIICDTRLESLDDINLFYCIINLQDTLSKRLDLVKDILKNPDIKVTFLNSLIQYLALQSSLYSDVRTYAKLINSPASNVSTTSSIFTPIKQSNDSNKAHIFDMVNHAIKSLHDQLPNDPLVFSNMANASPINKKAEKGKLEESITSLKEELEKISSSTALVEDEVEIFDIDERLEEVKNTINFLNKDGKDKVIDNFKKFLVGSNNDKEKVIEIVKKILSPFDYPELKDKLSNEEIEILESIDQYLIETPITKKSLTSEKGNITLGLNTYFDELPKFGTYNGYNSNYTSENYQNLIKESNQNNNKGYTRKAKSVEFSDDQSAIDYLMTTIDPKDRFITLDEQEAHKKYVRISKDVNEFAEAVRKHNDNLLIEMQEKQEFYNLIDKMKKINYHTLRERDKNSDYSKALHPYYEIKQLSYIFYQIKQKSKFLPKTISSDVVKIDNWLQHNLAIEGNIASNEVALVVRHPEKYREAKTFDTIINFFDTKRKIDKTTTPNIEIYKILGHFYAVLDAQKTQDQDMWNNNIFRLQNLSNNQIEKLRSEKSLFKAYTCNPDSYITSKNINKIINDNISDLVSTIRYGIKKEHFTYIRKKLSDITKDLINCSKDHNQSCDTNTFSYYFIKLFEKLSQSESRESYDYIIAETITTLSEYIKKNNTLDKMNLMTLHNVIKFLYCLLGNDKVIEQERSTKFLTDKIANKDKEKPYIPSTFRVDLNINRGSFGIHKKKEVNRLFAKGFYISCEVENTEHRHDDVNPYTTWACYNGLYYNRQQCIPNEATKKAHNLGKTDVVEEIDFEKSTLDAPRKLPPCEIPTHDYYPYLIRGNPQVSLKFGNYGGNRLLPVDYYLNKLLSESRELLEKISTNRLRNLDKDPNYHKYLELINKLNQITHSLSLFFKANKQDIYNKCFQYGVSEKQYKWLNSDEYLKLRDLTFEEFQAVFSNHDGISQEEQMRILFKNNLGPLKDFMLKNPTLILNEAHSKIKSFSNNIKMLENLKKILPKNSMSLDGSKESYDNRSNYRDFDAKAYEGTLASVFKESFTHFVHILQQVNKISDNIDEIHKKSLPPSLSQHIELKNNLKNTLSKSMHAVTSRYPFLEMLLKFISLKSAYAFAPAPDHIDEIKDEELKKLHLKNVMHGLLTFGLKTLFEMGDNKALAYRNRELIRNANKIIDHFNEETKIITPELKNIIKIMEELVNGKLNVKNQAKLIEYIYSFLPIIIRIVTQDREKLHSDFMAAEQERDFVLQAIGPSFSELLKTEIEDLAINIGIIIATSVVSMGVGSLITTAIESGVADTVAEVLTNTLNISEESLSNAVGMVSDILSVTSKIVNTVGVVENIMENPLHKMFGDFNSKGSNIALQVFMIGSAVLEGSPLESFSHTVLNKMSKLKETILKEQNLIEESALKPMVKAENIEKLEYIEEKEEQVRCKRGLEGQCSSRKRKIDKTNEEEVSRKKQKIDFYTNKEQELLKNTKTLFSINKIKLNQMFGIVLKDRIIGIHEPQFSMMLFDDDLVQLRTKLSAINHFIYLFHFSKENIKIPLLKLIDQVYQEQFKQFKNNKLHNLGLTKYTEENLAKLQTKLNKLKEELLDEKNSRMIPEIECNNEGEYSISKAKKLEFSEQPAFKPENKNIYFDYNAKKLALEPEINKYIITEKRTIYKKLSTFINDLQETQDQVKSFFKNNSGKSKLPKQLGKLLNDLRLQLKSLMNDYKNNPAVNGISMFLLEYIEEHKLLTDNLENLNDEEFNEILVQNNVKNNALLITSLDELSTQENIIQKTKRNSNDRISKSQTSFFNKLTKKTQMLNTYQIAKMQAEIFDGGINMLDYINNKIKDIESDISNLKNRKMKILTNSYLDEEILFALSPEDISHLGQIKKLYNEYIKNIEEDTNLLFTHNDFMIKTSKKLLSNFNRISKRLAEEANNNDAIATSTIDRIVEYIDELLYFKSHSFQDNLIQYLIRNVKGRIIRFREILELYDNSDLSTVNLQTIYVRELFSRIQDQIELESRAIKDNFIKFSKNFREYNNFEFKYKDDKVAIYYKNVNEAKITKQLVKKANKYRKKSLLADQATFLKEMKMRKEGFTELENEVKSKEDYYSSTSGTDNDNLYIRTKLLQKNKKISEVIDDSDRRHDAIVRLLDENTGLMTRLLEGNRILSTGIGIELPSRFSVYAESIPATILNEEEIFQDNINDNIQKYIHFVTPKSFPTTKLVSFSDTHIETLFYQLIDKDYLLETEEYETSSNSEEERTDRERRSANIAETEQEKEGLTYDDIFGDLTEEEKHQKNLLSAKSISKSYMFKYLDKISLYAKQSNQIEIMQYNSFKYNFIKQINKNYPQEYQLKSILSLIIDIINGVKIEEDKYKQAMDHIKLISSKYPDNSLISTIEEKFSLLSSFHNNKSKIIQNQLLVNTAQNILSLIYDDIINNTKKDVYDINILSADIYFSMKKTENELTILENSYMKEKYIPIAWLINDKVDFKDIHNSNINKDDSYIKNNANYINEIEKLQKIQLNLSDHKEHSALLFRINHIIEDIKQDFYSDSKLHSYSKSLSNQDRNNKQIDKNLKLSKKVIASTISYLDHLLSKANDLNIVPVKELRQEFLTNIKEKFSKEKLLKNTLTITPVPKQNETSPLPANGTKSHNRERRSFVGIT